MVDGLNLLNSLSVMILIIMGWKLYLVFELKMNI